MAPRYGRLGEFICDVRFFKLNALGDDREHVQIVVGTPLKAMNEVTGCDESIR